MASCLNEMENEGLVVSGRRVTSRRDAVAKIPEALRSQTFPRRVGYMRDRVDTLLGSILLALTTACACASSHELPSGLSRDGGTNGDGGATLVRCFPTDATRTLACDPATSFCVDNYAGAWSGMPGTFCQPLPAACATDATCGCVTSAFRCGIATTCRDGTPVLAICQPD